MATPNRLPTPYQFPSWREALPGVEERLLLPIIATGTSIKA